MESGITFICDRNILSTKALHNVLVVDFCNGTKTKEKEREREIIDAKRSAQLFCEIL
jgi:hypothetical protein